VVITSIVGDHRNSRSTIIECRVWRSSVLAFCDHRKSRLAG
jgi:hypothetical protein